MEERRNNKQGGGSLRQRGRLTKMSPFKSSPGSMVMQMLVWLSPWTLLGERGAERKRAAEGGRPCVYSLLPLPEGSWEGLLPLSLCQMRSSQKSWPHLPTLLSLGLGLRHWP